MKQKKSLRAFIFYSALTVIITAPSLAVAEDLPAKYKETMNKKIDAVKEEASRKVIKSWGYNKQVAELYCRPAAQDYLKLHYPNVDRLFLGMNTPGSLHREKNLLTGNGSMRDDNQWKDITFSCEFDPEKGTVNAFKLALAHDK
jgi:hypothetical protein